MTSQGSKSGSGSSYTPYEVNSSGTNSQVFQSLALSEVDLGAKPVRRAIVMITDLNHLEMRTTIATMVSQLDFDPLNSPLMLW